MKTYILWNIYWKSKNTFSWCVLFNSNTSKYLQSWYNKTGIHFIIRIYSRWHCWKRKPLVFLETTKMSLVASLLILVARTEFFENNISEAHSCIEIRLIFDWIFCCYTESFIIVCVVVLIIELSAIQKCLIGINLIQKSGWAFFFGVLKWLFLRSPFACLTQHRNIVGNSHYKFRLMHVFLHQTLAAVKIIVLAF